MNRDIKDVLARMLRVHNLRVVFPPGYMADWIHFGMPVLEAWDFLLSRPDLLNETMRLKMKDWQRAFELNDDEDPVIQEFYDILHGNGSLTVWNGLIVPDGYNYEPFKWFLLGQPLSMVPMLPDEVEDVLQEEVVVKEDVLKGKSVEERKAIVPVLVEKEKAQIREELTFRPKDGDNGVAKIKGAFQVEDMTLKELRAFVSQTLSNTPPEDLFERVSSVKQKGKTRIGVDVVRNAAANPRKPSLFAEKVVSNQVVKEIKPKPKKKKVNKEPQKKVVQEKFNSRSNDGVLQYHASEGIGQDRIVANIPYQNKKKGRLKDRNKPS